MIRKRVVIKKAFCDACGKKLSGEGQENDDKTTRDVHYGRLVNEFGFGSDLDGVDNTLGTLDLCEECYKKCFAVLKLPLSQHQVPFYHLKLVGEHRLLENDQPFNGEVGKELYYVHGWACKFCDWRDLDHGMSIPEHVCSTKKLIDARRDEQCLYCAGKHPEFDFEPLYSERADAWIHYPVVGHLQNPPVCGANEFILSKMHQEGRINPKFKEDLDRLDKEAGL
jgi:hypothetical protein